MAVLHTIALTCLLSIIYCQATKPANYQPVGDASQPWTTWSSCSQTCGAGFRTRTRDIDLNKTGSQKGVFQQEPCIDLKPVCEMTPWETWSGCSQTCGLGIRTRTRGFLHSDCTTDEATVQEEVCENGCVGDLRPVCGLTPWTSWTGCSQSCGLGIRTRTRGLLHSDCTTDEATVQEEVCENGCVGDLRPVCELAPWTPWTGCSQSCGLGIRTRTRALLHSDCTTDEATVQEEVCENGCVGVNSSPACMKELTKVGLHEPPAYRCSTSTIMPAEPVDLLQHIPMAGMAMLNNCALELTSLPWDTNKET